MNTTMSSSSPRDYARRCLAIKPRSARELKDKLLRKGFAPDQIAPVIDDLLSLGLLDDAKYAKLWVEGRISNKPMGAARLRAELAAKGVDREIIDAVLAQYKPEINEVDAALDLAQRKIRLLKGLDPITARRRLAGFLARRGYSPAVVSGTIKAILKTRIGDFREEGKW
ncbi:MAG: regulatory protein RecX [Candidatus Edwardsbacteria bacterium]|nr:regulatory protein RecX [Candidatus Edwardsbacteria bacterium]